ncbi:MAG: hypothetical protein M1820_005946 [Bogoriella megaspora]|nr:MAG: hypothetical protein M1820_005946 [Bogoriella megaspora]
MTAQQFWAEDICALKSNPTCFGIVERSHSDVDTHDPSPLREFPSGIEKHAGVKKRDFEEFLISGIPPKNHILVTWQQDYRTELIRTGLVELVDRDLEPGDVVKRDPHSLLSGIVINTSSKVDLCPLGLLPWGFLSGGSVNHPPVHGNRIAFAQKVRDVPLVELTSTHEYLDGDIVIYKDWVGRIIEVFNEVALRLSNGSVVVPEDTEELLQIQGGAGLPLGVGDIASFKKGNLRRGRWKYGAYDPNVATLGLVVEVHPVGLSIAWLSQRDDGIVRSSPNPPEFLEQDALMSGEVYVYDRSRRPPRSEGSNSLETQSPNLIIGQKVKFKDLTGACVKYQLSGEGEPGIVKIPRTETLGYDMNVFEVVGERTQVNVKWQDLTESTHESITLNPDMAFEDERSVWPGQIICTREGTQVENLPLPKDWGWQPHKVGVVQHVRAGDRTAQVKWFSDPRVAFVGDEHETTTLPASRTGPIGESVEVVSLYEIKVPLALNRMRGDLVLIYNDPTRSIIDAGENHWVGEVIDQGLDGQLTVRLGALKTVKDIRISVENTTLAWSHMMADGESNIDGTDYEETDSAGSGDMTGVELGYDPFSRRLERGNRNRENQHADDGIDEDDGWNDGWWTTDEEDEAMNDASDDTTMTDLGPEQAIPKYQAPETLPIPELSSTVTTQNLPDTLTLSDVDLDFSSSPNAPPSYALHEDSSHTTHHFSSSTRTSSTNLSLTKRIHKEHIILRESLPPGIYVRSWDTRLDLLRVLIVGPVDTPYELAPFVIDLWLGNGFPQKPPEVFFHSWGNSRDSSVNGGNVGSVNPNLYENGRICLSLLGTWHADSSGEAWSPARSTILQVLVSILGLVLVREPYYNEAGYSLLATDPTTKPSSALYTERTYFRTRAFIAHALANGVPGFNDVIRFLYTSTERGAPRLLDRAIRLAREVLERSEERDGEEGNGGAALVRDGLRRCSPGARVCLRREVERLERLRDAQGGDVGS